MCEAKINIKVIQDIFGHADFSTTMNIYTDATKDLKESEFKTLEEFLNSDKNSKQDNDFWNNFTVVVWHSNHNGDFLDRKNLKSDFKFKFIF